MDEQQAKAAKATQYLIDSSAEIATAKADLVRAENMLRVVKAMAMKHSGQTSAAAQEREAYASDQYRVAVDDLADVAGHYEKLRSLREAAKMQIEYWRSLNANQRGAERGYGSAA
jgi:rhamnose utilization protein RhaD (predicted bifunctional aldolase and dehydrogenase)